MQARHLVGCVAAVATTFLVTRAVYSDDTSKPSEAEMWKKVEAHAATVGEHSQLASFAGTWDAEVVCDMDGKQKTSKGTQSSELALGGRVVLSRFKGEMDGRPFEGLELCGYDKEKKQHWTIWCDSFGTGHLRMLGDRDTAGNVKKTSEMYDCPMGRNCTSTSVTKVVDADHVTFDMTSKCEDQTERTMTIRYTRRK